MTTCYLGLGSNLKGPERQLNNALRNISQISKTHIIKKSQIYRTQPIGKGWQPQFCNMVIHINTKLTPLQLLKHCQKIELRQQRVRKIHWGARTIDIDILLYGDLALQSPKLTIPHSLMHEREFVLIPLQEIL